MPIDDIMQSPNAIIFAMMLVLCIWLPAILALPVYVKNRIQDHRKKKQQAAEQQDRLARPKHWAAIDAERATTCEARRQSDIVHKQRQIDSLNATLAQRQAQLDALTSTPATETVTQAKQRLRTVQARYANAHLQQGDEKHYIIDAPNIFDVTVPETAAYLDAVAHAEQLLDGSTNDAATADAAMTKAVTAVEDAWEKMVSAALQAEQPWPVIIEKTPFEDTLTHVDDAAQSMQQAVLRHSADADQRQQTPPQQ